MVIQNYNGKMQFKIRRHIHMSIIYDASKLKVFELLGQLCEYTNKTANWKETFWSGLLQDPHEIGRAHV